jgi:predicted transcriptional regulator YheO
MDRQQEIYTYIRSFIPMVDFLAEILGNTSEVVLNDLTDLDHSVIAIRNATVSKRKIGDPATNLALRTMQAGKREKSQFLANYQGVSRGGHTLRSSTFFIGIKKN